jgi:hypothetical protein
VPGRVGVTGGSRWVVELPLGRRPVGQDGPGVAGREVGTCGNALIRAMDENERAYPAEDDERDDGGDEPASARIVGRCAADGVRPLG